MCDLSNVLVDLGDRIFHALTGVLAPATGVRESIDAGGSSAFPSPDSDLKHLLMN